MKLKFYGHACFLIETKGKRIIIDPFLRENPLNPTSLDKIGKLDLILLTHAHGDHIGNAVELALRDDAVIVAGSELAGYLQTKGVKTVAMGVGSSKDFEYVKVKFTQAIHSSSIREKGNIIYGGLASGILITADDKIVYHAGDTALFSDMKIIGEFNKIDLAILPIGDNLTMGVDDSIISAKWLGAEKNVPMHYNTFPMLKQNPEEWLEKLETAGMNGLIMNYNDEIEV